MEIFATLQFRPLPGEPRSASLDAVRLALEITGLMARGDRFMTTDRVVIVRDEESKYTLKTASTESDGGLRVLTVRLGPKNSEVKVVKGEASWTLRPDVTQTLASFRVVLAEKMTPADQFWKKTGPILDESEFSIEDALEEGILAIGPPASRSQKILIAKAVKSENLKFLEVDVSQTLAQLRTRLQGDSENVMTSTDRFAGSDGVPISQSQEAGCQIKDVIGANKLLTITTGRI